MINFINSWTRGIVIAVIISTVIEMILPNGSIKKYVRSIIGVYIVFAIISPIIAQITGKKINLKEYELPQTKSYEVTSLDTDAYIEKTYINKIKQEIKDGLKENGFTVNRMDIEIEKDDNNYGSINSMKINISKNNNDIKQIETINININNEIKTGEKNLTDEEINNIKNYLNANYGINMEKIYINE